MLCSRRSFACDISSRGVQCHRSGFIGCRRLGNAHLPAVVRTPVHRKRAAAAHQEAWARYSFGSSAVVTGAPSLRCFGVGVIHRGKGHNRPYAGVVLDGMRFRRQAGDVNASRIVRVGSVACEMHYLGCTSKWRGLRNR